MSLGCMSESDDDDDGDGDMAETGRNSLMIVLSKLDEERY
jgi:hypothetical protein